MKARTFLFCLAVPVAVLAGCARNDVEQEPAPVWTGPRPDATLVYQKSGGIHIHDWSGEPRLLAAGGSCPRFSPDGASVAFLRDKSVWTAACTGGREFRVASVEQPRAICWHPDGESLFFTDGDAVRQASLKGGQARTVVKGVRVMELDVASGGSLLLATTRALGGYRLTVFELPGGDSRTLASGCSASLSPDGAMATANQGGHEALSVVDVKTGAITDKLPAPTGIRLDNQFWSNHSDWIVGISEGDRQDVYLYDLPGKRVLRVTDCGGCDRPDLFVRNSGR